MGNATGSCCAPHNAWLADGNNEERLLLQHLAIGWCGHAIPRYERETGTRFEMVVFTRPDAIWWRPVLPWCAWPWNQQMMSCDAPACDMAWMVPRRHFERFAQQALMHRDCPLHKQAARGDNKKHVCCTTSEHLLAFARLHRNGTHLVSPSERIAISSAASGVLRHVGPLRAVHGICEVVLSHKLDTRVGHLPSASAGRYVFSQQVRHGLLASTLMNLRHVFVLNESLAGRTRNETRLEHELHACRRALAFFSWNASLGVGKPANFV